MLKRSARLLLTLIAGTLVGRPAGADEPYHFLKEIPIGGEGGWDYLSIDSGARRLYATHATKVVVIDLDKGEIVGEIRDTPGVHGFAIAPELGRGFASNGREAKASIVDLKTLETIGKVDTGENPDAILYEPEAQETYTFNGRRGKSATVFEAKTGKVVATIPLSGKPEFAVADRAAGRIFCNIEDKNDVAVIDFHAHKVVATWPIAPGEAASGMAIDLAHHRLFLGADNQLMVMMDSTNGKVLATVPIGEGVDANVFDPETGLAFASYDGALTIAREETPGKLTVVQKLETARRARTMALDPKTHDVYVATAQFEPAPEPAPGAAPQRPKVIDGTFKILVYGTR